MTQHLCDSEFLWCPADARNGDFYKLRVKDMSPTQFAVGKAEVAVRAGRMRKKYKKDPGKLHDYLRTRPIPIVVRAKKFYLVDHHHLVRALYDALHKTRGKDLAYDPYRSLAWIVREHHGYIKNNAPFSEFKWANYFRTRILLDSDILAGKHTFDDFAFEVDEHGRLEVTDDGHEVLEEALFLAASDEARGLPGFRGPMS